MKSVTPKDKSKGKRPRSREEVPSKSERSSKASRVKAEAESGDEGDNSSSYPKRGYYLSKVKGRKGVAVVIKHKDLDEVVELEDGIEWKLRKSGSEVFDVDDSDNSQTCQELFELIHMDMKDPSEKENTKGGIIHF